MDISSINLWWCIYWEKQEVDLHHPVNQNNEPSNLVWQLPSPVLAPTNSRVRLTKSSASDQ